MTATVTKLRTNSVDLPYYSYDKVYSYNGVYNFVVGGRGLGKTYGAKKQAVKNFIKRGEQFIYLRRYREEMKAARNTFFADFAHEFPQYIFRANGMEAQMAPNDGKEKPDWVTIGYFSVLSTAQQQKSVAFPKVTTIIFDEFIIEKGNIHYLPNEAVAFNNFYSTVDRWKDKTRVFFLANSVAISNPYFIAFDIKPEPDTDIVIRHEGFVVCHFADGTAFASKVFTTRFGKFIKGTEYADYAVGNQFTDNNDNLLEFKPSEARYAYTLQVPDMTFSLWKDPNGNYYIQQKRPKNELMFTTLPERMKEGVTLMLYNDKLMQYLRSSFRHGRVYFDDAKTRNAFLEIFKH